MINLDDYGDVGSAPPVEQSGIVKSTGGSSVGGMHPASMIALGALGIAIAASVGSSVPGVMRESQAYTARQERFQASGLQELSGSALEAAIKSAEPVRVDPQKPIEISTADDLMNVGWEQIIYNAKFPPGYYLTRQAVIVKELNGSGKEGISGASLGHSYTVIGADKAAERFTAYKQNRMKLEGKL
jgi:hypothetical protein